MPGIAVETTSTTPELTRRLETRRKPWSSRYSTKASSGVMRRARTVPCPGPRAGLKLDFVVAQVLGQPEGPRDARFPFQFDDEDRAPGHATPSGPVRRPSVVFPTPPLPATIRTWLCAQKIPTSMWG